ncbi:MAG: M1 family aminopeptidase [Deltaproteobacteria bacterium]|nr:M1 family aminopeptidase [Deltaproteobacteria bacterium]
MKNFFFLFLLFVPTVVFAWDMPSEKADLELFAKLLRVADKRLDLLKNEGVYNLKRFLPPILPQEVKPNEDFKILNMNLTILPTLGNSTGESKLIVNDQILIKVTGTDPLTSALFYVKSFEKITVDSPDTEVTYVVEPYAYDESISVVYINFKNPPPKDSLIRLSVTTEGKPVCTPSQFLSLITCQYNKELTYDLSLMHPLRADGKEDAFSFDLSIVVPDDYFTTVSGRFVGSIENGDGTKTELWHTDIATFVGFGMARYHRYSTVFEGEGKTKYPISSFVLPPRADKAIGFHPLIGEALSWYSKRFYPYQFQDISFNEISNAAGAAYATPMAQFIPTHIIESGVEDYQAVATFAHEIAHQWWGFMVLGSMYEYPWINEGLAEFSSMEFVMRDNPLARAFMYSVYAFLYFYTINPKDDVPICSDEIFKDDYSYVILTYYKGAVILAQLLNIMGEEFFNVMSQYVSKNLFQFTNISELVEIFNKVTGEDYSWYFDKWLFEAGYPIYTIKYDIKREKNKNYVDLFINQVSSTYDEESNSNPMFDMPLDIAFYDESRNEIGRVTERIREEVFEKSYEFDKNVHSLTVDPNIKIYLKRLRSALKGDINLDMEVDGRDVLITSYSYGYSWYSYFERENARFLPNADIDMNGTVDEEDLKSVVENFGRCLLSLCK